MSKNVIFYDLDGVLRLYNQDNTTPDQHEFVPERVKLFNTLVRRTAALPVLISNWRHRIDVASAMLSSSGLLVNPQQHVSVALPRSSAISLWLASHPYVQRWAVLDDKLDNYIGWSPVQLQSLFLCTGRFGLRPSICRAVEGHLTGNLTIEPAFDCQDSAL